MERLKVMKDDLICIVQEQMEHLDCVDAKELGEAIDMIKDLAEAIYYCTVTEAMHQKEHENAPMYHWEPTTVEMDSTHEGRSHKQRSVYIEAKQKHHGKAKQLQELEKYMKDLASDLTDMIEDSSPEEKQYLGNRLSALAMKIAKLDNE